MPKTIIFDTEATDKNNPVIIEAAWLELTSLDPFTTALFMPLLLGMQRLFTMLVVGVIFPF
jgi:hypothetical protein